MQVCILSALQKKNLKKIKKFFVLSKKDIPLTQQLTLLTMENKNEIKIVSKELTKYRVSLTTTIEIEIDVYAETPHDAELIAEREIKIYEYADSIGIEVEGEDLTREGDNKVELISVSGGGYVEAYDSHEVDSVTLYAREEDGFDNPENVFISEEDLLEEYSEEEE
jgi:hypothetical protein